MVIAGRVQSCPAPFISHRTRSVHRDNLDRAQVHDDRVVQPRKACPAGASRPLATIAPVEYLQAAPTLAGNHPARHDHRTALAMAHSGAVALDKAAAVDAQKKGIQSARPNGSSGIGDLNAHV